MESHERIADAGNTQVPAVLTLRSLGFVVRREAQASHELWYAETPALTLMAKDPLSLLGLANLRSSRGTDWKATDREIEDVFCDYDLT